MQVDLVVELSEAVELVQVLVCALWRLHWLPQASVVGALTSPAEWRLWRTWPRRYRTFKIRFSTSLALRRLGITASDTWHNSDRLVQVHLPLSRDPLSYPTAAAIGIWLHIRNCSWFSSCRQSGDSHKVAESWWVAGGCLPATSQFSSRTTLWDRTFRIKHEGRRESYQAHQD